MALINQKGHITDTEFQKLIASDLDVSSFKRETHIDGLAPYFRAELGKWLKALFSDPKFLRQMVQVTISTKMD